MKQIIFLQKYLEDFIKYSLNISRVFQSERPKGYETSNIILIDVKTIKNIPSFNNDLYEIEFNISSFFNTQNKNLFVAEKILSIFKKKDLSNISNEFLIKNIISKNILIFGNQKLILEYLFLIQIYNCKYE